MIQYKRWKMFLDISSLNTETIKFSQSFNMYMNVLLYFCDIHTQIPLWAADNKSNISNHLVCHTLCKFIVSWNIHKMSFFSLSLSLSFSMQWQIKHIVYKYVRYIHRYMFVLKHSPFRKCRFSFFFSFVPSFCLT